MAENSSAMPSASDSDTFLPTYKDITDFTQQTLKAVLMAVRTSNDLPAAGDDFDYYSSYQGFRDLLDVEGKRILHIIQNVLKYQGLKGKLSIGTSDVLDLEDKFDVIIDSNDQILERVGAWLDEASGIKKNDTTLVIASASPKQVNTSWNKKTNVTTPKSMSSYHLLTARNIQRPQLRFKDKVDNGNRCFVPRIKHKPNALVSLEESMKLSEDITEEALQDPDFLYPHPYQAELDHWKPTPEMLFQTEPVNPPPVDETELAYITTVEGLVELCDILKSCSVIAVDLEHHSYRTFQGITCLVQISTQNKDFLVDALELRSDLHLLNEVFTNPSIVKVFHGADSDIYWLQRDLGLYVVNMFDTGQAARVLNLARFSLAHLLQAYCGITADKQYQLADWRIRPLPYELQKYAREDTHYLIYIYQKMKKELIDRGNEQKNLLLSVLQRSTEVCAKVYKKLIFKDDAYLDLYHKSKKIFNSQQLEALKNLFKWRDHTARVEDESIGYVLPNHMLLQISEILPREKQGIFACCNPIPPLVRQFVNEIFCIIMEAREKPLTKVEIRKPIQPSQQQHPKYDGEGLLRCPHDLSHQKESKPDLPCILNSDGALSSDVSINKIPTKSVPSISAFDDKDNDVHMSAAQKLARTISAMFVSPFVKFLPESGNTIIKPGKLEQDKRKIELTDVSWKLMQSTLKRKEPEVLAGPSEKVAVEPPAKKKKIEEEQEDLSVKQIQFQSRKQRLEARKNEELPEKLPEKKKKKKDKQREQTEESQEKSFTPYDYSQSDKKMFEGGADKSGVFDPYKQGKSKGHKVKKPKLSNAKSNKVHSYTNKGETKKKQHWPKK